MFIHICHKLALETVLNRSAVALFFKNGAQNSQKKHKAGHKVYLHIPYTLEIKARESRPEPAVSAFITAIEVALSQGTLNKGP